MGYSTLLFLHVTSAFTMVTAAGLFLAIALAQRSDRHSATALRLAPVASILWPIGGLLAIVFGVWLALHDSQYSLGRRGTCSRNAVFQSDCDNQVESSSTIVCDHHSPGEQPVVQPSRNGAAGGVGLRSGIDLMPFASTSLEARMAIG